MLGPGPGSVLDAGMGPGRLCAELAGRGWTVSGIDAADGMVAAARERLPEAADRLVRADVESLPFDNRSFDAVTVTGVLEYAQIPRALAEVARVLRPGGRAVVSYPSPHALYGNWKVRVYYPAVRVAKRVLGRPHPWLPRGAGGGPIDPKGFLTRLRAADLEPETFEHCGFLLLPSPVDIVLPGVAARIGQALEGRAPSVLATQVVYAARRR
jgi:SAM-dependent methyltransferase